jgi:tetratricopeptide (TPR) repeat protein/predicted nucleic acid-binding protein
MTDPVSISVISLISGIAKSLAVRTATDKVTNWSTLGAVQRAVDAVALGYSEYDGLAYQLRDWTSRAEVDEILGRHKQTAKGVGDLGVLASVLESCGFTPTNDGPTATRIVEHFLKALSEELLKDEDSTHSTAVLRGEVRDVGKEIVGEVRALGDTIVRASNASAPSSIAPDALSTAKELIEGGEPTAALAWLEKHPPKGLADNYEVLATTGNALMHLGRLAEAEAKFREALDLRPTRPNALANLGTVVLYQGKGEEALQLARKALALEGANAAALRLAAQAYARRNEWEAAFLAAGAIPIEWEREYATGTLHLWHGDSEPAVEALEVAYGLKSDEPWLIFNLASALLLRAQAAQEKAELSPWSSPPEPVEKDLAQAEALLDASVRMFKKRQMSEGLALSLHQRAALRLVRNGDLALITQDFRDALAAAPPTSALVQAAAAFWNAHGTPSAALEVIEAFKRSSQLTPQLRLLHAQSLFVTNRNDEALAVLHDLEESNPEQDKSIAIVKLDILLAKGDLTEASAILEGVPEALRKRWDFAIRLADLQAKQNDLERAATTLREALELGGKEAWRVRLMLADILARAEDWAGAAELYRVVFTGSQGPAVLLSRFLACLFNADQIETSLERAEAIRRDRGMMLETAEVEAQALEALGRVADAEHLYRELLKKNPGVARIQLRLAVTQYRQGDQSAALNSLPTTDSVKQLSWRQGMEVSFLRSTLGDPRGAIAAAYLTYVSHPDSPEAHLGFIGAFMRTEKLNEEFLRAESATSGTWVTLATRNGQQVHRLLASDEESRSPSDHSSGSSFARAIAGKRKGDSIPLVEDGVGREDAQILDVRSRYVGALNDIFANFATRFPGQGGLRAIPFHGPEDLPALKQVLTDRRKQVDEMIAQYQALPLPMTTLARLLGQSDVDMWYHLISQNAVPVLVADGAPQAQVSTAGDASDESRGLVLETTALMALAELRLLEHLPKLKRPLFVAQSVLDEFDGARIDRVQLAERGGSYTLEERGGEIVQVEIRPDELRAKAAFFEAMLDWVRNPENCMIKGTPAQLGGLRRSLQEMMSRGSTDSIAIAKDTDAILLSDDHRLQLFAAGEFNCRSIASLHMVGALERAGVIGEGEYDEAILTELQWGYSFVPINPRLAEAAYRGDGYRVGPRFQAVLRQIADPTTTLVPVINIAAQFLRGQKLRSRVAGPLDPAVVGVLFALSKRGNWPRTEALLRARVRTLLMLAPLQLGALEQDIAAWKRARLLA